MILKSYTSATVNYICDENTVILNKLESKIHDIRVRLTNSSIINPTKQVNLPLTKFSSQATHSHLLPNLNISSLLSIGQLCDLDCSALYTKTGVAIFNSQNERFLNGQHNQSYVIWDVNISSSQQS